MDASPPPSGAARQGSSRDRLAVGFGLIVEDIGCICSTELVEESWRDDMRQLLGAAAIAAAVFAVGARSADAAVICTGCDPQGGAGTYIGAYDPTANDSGTFEHQEIPAGAFSDFWVFDIAPSGDAATSANFAALAPITGFDGALFADGGSTCGGAPGAPTACTAIVTGALVTSGSTGTDSWASGVVALLPGRYILNLFGTAGSPFGTYTGQLATAATPAPEPATLALLGLGLGTASLVARRRRKTQ